jgi:hypothetical protein
MTKPKTNKHTPVYKLIFSARAVVRKYPINKTSATKVKKKPITKLSWLNFSSIKYFLEEEEVEQNSDDQ